MRAKVDSQKQSFWKKSVEMLAAHFEIALFEGNMVLLWHTLCREGWDYKGYCITSCTQCSVHLSAIVWCTIMYITFSHFRLCSWRSSINLIWIFVGFEWRQIFELRKVLKDAEVRMTLGAIVGNLGRTKGSDSDTWWPSLRGCKLGG